MTNLDCIYRDTALRECDQDGAYGMISKYDIDRLPSADVVPWWWLEDFADDIWAPIEVFDFLKVARDAYKRRLALEKSGQDPDLRSRCRYEPR